MPVKTEELALPNFGTAPKKLDTDKYRVRYLKADLNDPGSIAELEIIETRGLSGEEIVLLSKDKFTFMEKYFIVLSYLELREQTD